MLSIEHIVYLSLISLLVEVLVKFFANPLYNSEIVTEHDRAESYSNKQRGASLSVAALVFAALTLILGESPDNFVIEIQIFIISFSLLLIAALTYDFVQTRNFFIMFQEICFEYGLIVLSLGLVVFVRSVVPEASPVPELCLLVIILVRYWSAWGEIRTHWITHDNKYDKKRRSFISEIPSKVCGYFCFWKEDK